MIRYSVINNISGLETNSWLSSSGRDASYYEPCFGKPLRWVRQGEEDISAATATRTVTDSFGNTHEEFQLPAQYTVMSVDVTAQAALQAATDKALQNQAAGAGVIARVAALNEQKLGTGTMTQQTFTALLSDQNVLNIERLLWNGSLVTAKALIQSTNLSAYYTSDEISSIVALIIT